MAAAGALRQLLLQTIRRPIATGRTSITTEVAARQQRTERLIREAARARLGISLALGSIYAAGFALIYYGPNFPRKGNAYYSEPQQLNDKEPVASDKQLKQDEFN